MMMLVGSTYSLDTPDKEIIHVLRRVERDSTRFHNAIENGAQFKTYAFL
jgi:hypothetical protein